MADGTPISYRAAQRGLPVLDSSGGHIGTLEHVLEVSDLDIFDGVVIATKHGLRFVDADQIVDIATTGIQTSLDHAQASQLPAPSGPPVYTVDALADSGHSLHDVLGRFFGRPHWKRKID